jgi:hypothetical protein
MPQQGQYSAADVTPPPQSAQQQGQFTAADIDQSSQLPRGFLANIESKLPGANDTGLRGAVHHLGDTWNTAGKPIADVSTPGILYQLYKKFTGQSNEVNQLPGKMVSAFALSGEPEADIEAGAPPVRGEASASLPAESSSGMLSRAWEVAKRRAGHIPGVQAVKDIGYVMRGNPDAAPATPPAPTPSLPEFWGKGQYGTPVDQWGQRIPQQASPPSEPETPAPTLRRGSLSQMMRDLDQPTRDAFNVPPPPAPGQPIAQRGGISAAMNQGEEMPQGHSAIQGSSAARSKMYDAGAREFHARYKSGDTTYVYGDVSPEEADAFDKADSKGQALQQIKNAHPLVAKIVNGKRIAVKAAQ